MKYCVSLNHITSNYITNKNTNLTTKIRFQGKYIDMVYACVSSCMRYTDWLPPLKI